MSLPSPFAFLTKSVFVLFFLFTSMLTQAEAAAGTPLVLYNFNEGSGSKVYDVSGNGKPLNLKIRNTGNIRWLQGGGLSVDRPTLIKTTGPARKLTKAIRASNALTIEAWIRPASKTQTGPARIVTLSADPHNRNLTLGQNKSAYDTRLRTTKTNDNGTPSLRSAKGTVAARLTHIVYTRNSSGLARLYINGVLKSKKRVRGNLGNWNGGYGFALANELKGNRPWTGNFYQVAIYDQALSSPEIAVNFMSSPNNKGRSRSSQASQRTKSSSNKASQRTKSSSNKASQRTAGSNSASSGTLSEAGSVFLSWNAPVARSNGKALAMNEIKGYTLYYGKTAGIYPNSISINDAYTTSAIVTELPPGTYYFVVTTRDIAGGESGYSKFTRKWVL